jgi:hypothetical protein
MQKLLSPLGAAVLLSLTLPSPASASAVTAADLSGKKIYWDSGSASVYGRGGNYSNNLSGEGTWSITGAGVHVHTDRYDYVAAIHKLPDGSFQAVINGAGIKSSGTYCK